MGTVIRTVGTENTEESISPRVARRAQTDGRTNLVLVGDPPVAREFGIIAPFTVDDFDPQGRMKPDSDDLPDGIADSPGQSKRAAFRTWLIGGWRFEWPAAPVQGVPIGGCPMLDRSRR